MRKTVAIVPRDFSIIQICQGVKTPDPSFKCSLERNRQSEPCPVWLVILFKRSFLGRGSHLGIVLVLSSQSKLSIKSSDHLKKANGHIKQLK